MAGSIRRFLAGVLGTLAIGLAAPVTVVNAQPAAASSAPVTPPPVGASPDAGAAPATSPTTDASTATSDASYVLGPQDVIEVSVLGRSDFTTRARIGDNGTIQLPFLGTIPAANMTSPQLGASISAALIKGGYFSAPILRVEIVAYGSRYVTVLGEVASPGLVPVDRRYHLSEVLARVGGAKEDAADYVVVRPENGPQQHYSIRALITGDADQDPIVSPGDKIFLPKAELFYISGQVKGGGAFAVESGMTLRMAIARGGGLTDLGSDHGIKITGVDGKVRQLQLDDRIAAGDVIVVGERLF
jgi:polysaccharide export outer membrane protein